jgi:hypothetical protein
MQPPVAHILDTASRQVIRYTSSEDYICTYSTLVYVYTTACHVSNRYFPWFVLNPETGSYVYFNEQLQCTFFPLEGIKFNPSK